MTQPASVEATIQAPPVVLQLRDATGAPVALSGGTFAVELAPNDEAVNLNGSVIAAAVDGSVRFDKLMFDRPGRHLRLVVHGGDLTATSEPFDVGNTAPAVFDVSVGGVVDSCATVTYRLKQAQSLPVDLLVEFDPDGASGPLPYRRATQAGSEPGKAGVDGVPGSPEGRIRTFSWNTTADAPRTDSVGTLRMTPSVRGTPGEAVEVPVTVRNAPRFVPFDLGPGSGIRHEIDGDRDGTFFASTIDQTNHSISVDGMDELPIPEGASVHDFAIGDFNGDGRFDLVASFSTGTVVAFQQRAGAGHLAPAVEVAAAFRQVVTADLDRDGLAEIIGVEASSGDVVVLRSSRAEPGPPVEVARPWPGGGASTVALADLDRDGWTDLVIGRSSATGPVVAVRGTSTGFEAARSDSGLVGGVVAVGDFDSDGRDDIASLDAHGLHVAASSAGRVDLASISGSVMEIHDVDGDTLPDVVIARSDGVYLYQHVAERGSVAFLPAVLVGATSGVTSLIVGELNRNRVDIYALENADPANERTVIFNNTTPRACQVKLGGPIGSPYDVVTPGVLADVNADGKVDFVSMRVGVGEHGRLVSLLGRGDGRFESKALSLYEWIESPGPRDLQAGDFDGDGAVDLAFLSFAEPASLITFFNDRLSPGTFLPVSQPLTYPESLVITDIDGDGQSDLVILDDGRLQIRRGIPGMSRVYASPEVLPTVVDAAGPLGYCRYGCQVVTSDLDADGHVDIVVKTPTQLFVFPADPGAPTGFREPVAMALEAGFEGIADALGDSRPELFFSRGSLDASDKFISAYTFDRTRSVIEKVWQSPTSSTFNEKVGTVFSVDLDGDGHKETLLDYRNALAVLTKGANPVPEALSPTYVPAAGDSFVVGDVDGDGFDDIVVANYAGLFTIRVDARGVRDLGRLLTTRGVGERGGFGNALSVGELDGDGLPDLTVRDDVAQRLYLERQSSSHPGTLASAEVALPSVYFSALADLDRDRRDDVVTYGVNGDLAYLDPLGAARAIPCVADWPSYPFAVGDVDNDGHADIVESGASDVLLVSQLADACPAPVSVMPLARPDGPSWHPLALKLADMNHDGFLDVVVVADAVRIALQDPDSPGSFTVTDYERQINPDQIPYLDLDVADLDHDGALDVVVIDGNNAIRVFFGNRAAPGRLFASQAIEDPLVGSRRTSISIGDVDSDGRPDLVTGQGYRTEVFVQDGDPSDLLAPAHFSFAYTTTGPNDFIFSSEEPTLVDFDRDGHNDIVFADPRQGTILFRGR